MENHTHIYFYNPSTKEIKDCLGSYLNREATKYILSSGFLQISQAEYEIYSLCNRLDLSLEDIKSVINEMQEMAK